MQTGLVTLVSTLARDTYVYACVYTYVYTCVHFAHSRASLAFLSHHPWRRWQQQVRTT